MINLFKKHTKEQHTDALASYLPSGPLFEGARYKDTNLRKLLKGFSAELSLVENFLRVIVQEYDITTTTLFIDEWEAALGIPDDCIPSKSEDIAQRRLNVLTKLAALGVQTVDDFEALAAIFGKVVTVTQDTTKYTIHINFVPTDLDVFPLTFPFTFGDKTISILECLFNDLKPANCAVVFTAV